MVSFCPDKHKLYQADYQKFVSFNDKSKNHKLLEKKPDFESEIYNVRIYKSNNHSDSSQPLFVVIPSLFNSPEILLFNEEQNFIEYLSLMGNVYLIEWKEIGKDIELSDYAQSVANIVNSISKNISSKIHLVGHCIGGNLAIFSTFITKQVASLTLLTTPWDYSHFARAFHLAEYFELRKSIKELKTIPKIYIQIMFFMLFPRQYEKKIIKYFSLDKDSFKEKYLRVEQWLQSGIDLPNSLYNEILDTIISQNLLVNKGFSIDGNLVELSHINIPTCIISAKDDQIAPASSILPLQKEIKNSKLITVEGGHIGYLVNNDLKFKENYTNWLKNNYLI